MGSRRWRRNRRLKCCCGGWWFPHRRGSQGAAGGRFDGAGCEYRAWWWGDTGRPGQPAAPGVVPF